MKIGFIQFNPKFGDREGNIEKVRGLAGQTDADLLVLPELFATGYVFTSQEEANALAEEVPGGMTTEALCGIARARNTVIVAGLAEREGDHLFNSAVIVSPRGYMGTYRKIHLFSEEKLWFRPGDGGFKVFDIGACRIGVMVCFDWIFPESMRSLALMGAHIVCHPANLVLPYCQDAMKTRCLENRVFSITANRTGREKRPGKSLSFTGKSRMVAPDSTVLFTAGRSTEEVGVVDVDPLKAENKQINDYNQIFSDRRPEFYGPLLSGG